VAMRSKQQRVTYYLECDRCGLQSYPAADKDVTRCFARAEGWLIEERWNGYAYIQTHICPQCQAEEDEGNV